MPRNSSTEVRGIRWETATEKDSTFSRKPRSSTRRRKRNTCAAVTGALTLTDQLHVQSSPARSPTKTFFYPSCPRATGRAAETSQETWSLDVEEKWKEKWKGMNTPSTVASETDAWCVSDLELEIPSPKKPTESLLDVVVDGCGALFLQPVDGKQPRRALSELGPEDLVTVRAVRFFEERGDERHQWEKELRNVNSGSLMWLPVHMEPKMHSVKGAKYGEWFTVHHIRVYAKHLSSPYHMCQEGSCTLANSFGTTIGLNLLVTGEKLATGYVWFVSPDRQGSGQSCEDVTGEENLQKQGWQHVAREGPFSGEAFLTEWRKQGSPLDELSLQRVLRRVAK